MLHKYECSSVTLVFYSVVLVLLAAWLHGSAAVPLVLSNNGGLEHSSYARMVVPTLPKALLYL